MSRRTIVIIVILLVVLTPPVLIFTGVFQKKQVTPTPVSLVWWTTDNSLKTLQPIVDAYRKLHPYVSISVVQRNPETYDQDLKEAWAKDQGPDIFEIPNTAVTSYKDFITPLPKSTRVAYYKTRKLIVRQEQEITFQTETALTPRQIRSDFIDLVGKDVILSGGRGGEQIYGLPLAVDTLMLFYNRDLLNSAGIFDPPATWEDLVGQIPKLTLQDSSGAIVRPGIGLGLASNIPYAFDLLSLLMLQNGAAMTDATGTVSTFHRPGNEGENPGLGALEFYTDFALTNPPKEVFTWAPTFPSALELFAQGKLAYAFGYQKDRVRITEQAPALGFTVAPIPHIHENEKDNDASAPPDDQLRKITYGRAMIQTVSLKARGKANEAWNLLQFASRGNAVKAYLQKTKQVSALRNIIKTQEADPDLAIPALQALAAHSWYRGTNAAKAEEYFAKMIDDVALHGVSTSQALQLTSSQIQQLLPPAP